MILNICQRGEGWVAEGRDSLNYFFLFQIPPNGFSTNQNPRNAGAVFFSFIISSYLCWFVIFLGCPRLADRMKTDEDLKFGTDTCLGLNMFFLFYRKKTTMRAARLEELPRHVDISHYLLVFIFVTIQMRKNTNFN